MRKVRGPIALLIVLGVAASCSVPRLDELHPRALAQTSFLYAADGSLITTLHARENRVVLSRSQMTNDVRNAVVAIEDRRFFDHHGVDPEAILRAAINDLRTGHIVEGGSTITQQLVKNLYTGDQQSFRRKLDEAALAWQMENQLTKQQILTAYLNTVYFGEGAYGVQAAARTYFGIDAADLTLAQSAMLAGLITAPNHFDPYARPRSALGRRNVVLRLMLQQGLIPRARQRAALQEKITLRADTTGDRYPYPYFVDYFKQWFLSNPAFGATYDDRYRLLFTGGLRITTTLDPAVQSAAQDAVSSVLAYPSDPDAAVTVLDPRTGYVRAMVGGDDAHYWANDAAGRVNLATGMGGSGRQTGSAFKAFALVAALEHGISPDTVFAAPASIDIPLPGGGIWHVTNAEGNGYGAMSLRSATVDSVNTVYAQVIERLTPQTVVDTAERMGMRCCTERLGADDAAPSPDVRGARLERSEHARDGERLRNARHRRSPRRSRARGDGQRRRRQRAVAGRSQAATGDRPADRLGGRRHPAGRRALRHRHGREHRAAADREDGDRRQSRQRMVHRLRPPADRGRVGRLPPGADPDGAAEDEVDGVRRDLAGADLASAHAEGNGGAGGGVLPDPGRSLHLDRGRRDAGSRTACRTRTRCPQHVEVLHFIAGTAPTTVCATPTSLQKVLVPSVVGFSQQDATSTLEGAGFYVRIALASSTQPAGTVIYQTPGGGLAEFQTSTITVTISKPPKTAGG